MKILNKIFPSFSHRKRLLLSLLALLVLLLLLSSYFYSVNSCDELRMVNTSVTVDYGKKNFIGLNTDTDSLAFGKVSPQSTVERSIEVASLKNTEVEIMVKGEISPWLSANYPAFSISANKKEKIFFYLNVPADALAGDYQGMVYFCFRE
ncbi:hypothetical protein HYX12_01245 [Candidatus Woesearchaeota archaeon]|nr:hypothetical protein [Candidatus Woesearchaeota archaeon]